MYSISYGGFVAYKMAEIWPEMVEKLVIVSSGVGFTQQQKTVEMKKHGRDCSKILVPKTPMDLRLLIKISMNTGLTFIDWVPDFVLSQFIAVSFYVSVYQKKMFLCFCFFFSCLFANLVL